MTLTNMKRTLLGGFLSTALVSMMASCGNDTGTASGKEQTTSADTSTTATTDTMAAAKPVAKKKKGKASGMLSMDNTTKIEKDKEGVYTKAEKMPEYPGGDAALSKFVENNISYPQDAIDQDKEGTVNVSFVVDEKGKVIMPMVTGKAAGGGLDEEAVKVVKQMPVWKPGMVKGKAVKTRLSLPVTFKLADA